jgi:hypothetical protein
MYDSSVYIDFFLTYGYFPRKRENTIEFKSNNVDYSGATLEELSILAKNKFLAGIDKEFKDNTKHVVPLSGGLDSRAILAALLEFTDSKNIYSYSFGSKGTLDYEIAKKVADHTGINHITFDLQSYKFDLDDLLYQSKAVGMQTFLFHGPPQRQVDEIFSGFEFWSGILGDVVAGSAIPKHESLTHEELVRKYIKGKKYIKGSSIRECSEFLEYIFTDISLKETKLTLDEKLIFTERYENSYRPHICPSGHIYREPFINNEFSEMFFNVSRKLRVNSTLYKEMLKQLSPSLFLLPTKNNLGENLFSSNYSMLSRKAINKFKRGFQSSKIPAGTNYFSFSQKMKSDGYFNELVLSQLKDLDLRKILTISSVDQYIQHMNGDLCEELIKTLVALEVHLKNGKKIPISGDEL